MIYKYYLKNVMHRFLNPFLKISRSPTVQISKLIAKSEFVHHLAAEKRQNVFKHSHAKVGGHFALFRNVMYNNN